MNWIKLSGPDILQEPDFVRPVDTPGKKICLIKTGDKFFATQFYCPHAGAALAYGWCKQGKLVCPFHRYEYDLETGKGAAGQGDYIYTYPVEVREDGIYAKLPEPGFFKKMFGLK